MLSRLPFSICFSTVIILLASGPVTSQLRPKIDIHLHDGKLESKMNILISGRRDHVKEQHIIYTGVSNVRAAHHDNYHFFRKMDKQKQGEDRSHRTRFHTPKRWYYHSTGTPFKDENGRRIRMPHEELFTRPQGNSEPPERLLSPHELPEKVVASRNNAQVEIKQTGPMRLRWVIWLLQHLSNEGADVTKFHLSPGYNSWQDIGNPDGSPSDDTKQYAQNLTTMVHHYFPNAVVYLTNSEFHFNGPQGGTLPYHEMIGRVPTTHLRQVGPNDTFYKRVLDKSIRCLGGLQAVGGLAMPYTDLWNQPITPQDIWRVRYNGINDVNTHRLRQHLLAAINHNQNFFLPTDPLYKHLEAVKEGLSECRGDTAAYNHDSILARAKSTQSIGFLPVQVDDSFQLIHSTPETAHGYAPLPQGDEHSHALNEMKFFLPRYGKRVRENPGYEHVRLDRRPI